MGDIDAHGGSYGARYGNSEEQGTLKGSQAYNALQEPYAASHKHAYQQPHPSSNSYYGDPAFGVPPPHSHAPPTSLGSDPYIAQSNGLTPRTDSIALQSAYQSSAEQGDSYIGYATYPPDATEPDVLRDTLTSDMLHTWQRPQNPHAEQPGAGSGAFPHYTLPPDPGYHGKEEGHPGFSDQPTAFPGEINASYDHEHRQAMRPHASGLSLNTESLSLVGSGSDTSSRPSPLHPHPDRFPTWYTGIPNTHSTRMPFAGVPSGVSGHDGPAALSHIASLSSDTTSSSLFDHVPRESPAHTPYIHSPAIGPSSYSHGPDEQPWAVYDGYGLESPPIAGIIRMEAPIDYFQQMPVHSRPPYSVPLPGPSMPRELPKFSSPAVPSINLPQPPQNSPYPPLKKPLRDLTAAAQAIEAGKSAERGAPSSSKKGLEKTAQGKRENRKYDGVCDHCGNLFAILYLRGYESDYKDAFTFAYLCLDCAPNNITQPSASKSVGSSTPPETGLAEKTEKKKEKGNNRKRYRLNDSNGAASCTSVY